MSRGLGKLQRDLLETLEQNTSEIDTLTLAALVYQANSGVTTLYRHLITDAQHAAVRRALRNLHKRGLVVELGRRYRNNCCHWATLKVGLPAQLDRLQSMATGYGIRSSPAKAAKIRAEIAETQERMKQLGIEPKDRPSGANPDYS
jgi:hypothetical protein